MSANIYNLLKVKYPAEECVLVKEVADSGIRRRYLDYMVINLWESRGQSIIGFEEKAYRSDWIKELKNPAKQELHVPYCDYFYLITADDTIAKLEEIPENWGWMVAKGGKLHTIKKAPKLNAKPIPRSLMVSIIRRAADKAGYVHTDEIKSEIQKAVSNEREYNERQTKMLQDNYQDLKKRVAEFEQASGLNFHRFSYLGNAKEIGEAVKLLLQGNALQRYKNMFSESGRITEQLGQIVNALQNLEDDSKKQQIQDNH